MGDAEEVALAWQGPITPGDYVQVDDPDFMQEPAVYLCVMEYQKNIAVYVGMTKNILLRLRDHIVATLGLTYTLRDDDARTRYEPRAIHRFFADLRHMTTHQALAAAEVRRMVWYFAPAETQGLRYLEGLLIRCLKSLADSEFRIGGKIVVCDNLQMGTSPIGPIRLQMHGAEMPVELFGTTLSWPLKARI